MEAIKKCSSCRAGEIDEPADFYVTGRYQQRPFQGYLCVAHFEMMQEQDDEFRAKHKARKVSK